MTLYREAGFLEWGLLLSFVLFYLIFLGRIFWISRRLRLFSKSFLVKLLLRSTYFLLLLWALLGPSFGKMAREVQSVGKDIYVLVDLSHSMNAFDVQPSRLEKVKFELKKVVSAFSADRIGLIVFSSDAFLQCPLTYDNAALMMFLETLHTGLVSNTGTDFLPPLRMALTKHEKATEKKGGAQKEQSKIILLVSDGEDFGEETVSVAEKIKDSGVKLFTLGVGTAKGSKILEGGSFKRDKKGNDVVSALNAKALQKLSDITGGQYFELSENRNQVGQMIEAIGQIKGEFRDKRQVDVSANKYYYFLALAILLIALDILFTVRIIKL